MFFYFLVNSSNFLCGFKVNFLETNIFCFFWLSDCVDKVASCKFPIESVRLIASCNFPIASDHEWLTFSALCNPPLYTAYSQWHQLASCEIERSQRGYDGMLISCLYQIKHLTKMSFTTDLNPRVLIYLTNTNQEVMAGLQPFWTWTSKDLFFFLISLKTLLICFKSILQSRSVIAS